MGALLRDGGWEQGYRVSANRHQEAVGRRERVSGWRIGGDPWSRGRNGRQDDRAVATGRWIEKEKADPSRTKRAQDDRHIFCLVDGKNAAVRLRP